MARTFSIGRSKNISRRQRRLSYSGWAGARANLGVDWGFLLCAAWAKDLEAYLGTWGLVAIFVGVGLTVAVLAWWRWRRCSRHHWSRSRHVLGKCREISKGRDFALALALFVSNNSKGSFLHCWLINCHLSI